MRCFFTLQKTPLLFREVKIVFWSKLHCSEMKFFVFCNAYSFKNPDFKAKNKFCSIRKKMGIESVYLHRR